MNRNLKESYAYWIAQGYSPEQAAALVGGEQGESGGDPNARGDGGAAFGNAQWHQKRRQKIFAGTGIDVASASHADQLKAQAWEMNQMGITKDTLPNNIGDASGFLVKNYEMSANQAKDSAMRTAYAMQIAKSQMSGGSSNSSSIVTGDINVHTQATDAPGIAREIKHHLQKQFQGLAANYDDGEAR